MPVPRNALTRTLKKLYDWLDANAGGSSLTIGTTATTAKAGNYTPTSAEVSTALKAKAQVAALTAVSVANATDEATAIALANANKTAINAIITALKA